MAMKLVPSSGITAGGIRRRRFVAAVPAVLAGASILPACSPAPVPESYETVATRIRRADAAVGIEDAALGQELPRELVSELVRLATLAPSSHNTQCWRFAVEAFASSCRTFKGPSRFG